MYSSICPANDWFYVFDSPEPGVPTVVPIAAWAARQGGGVVGLMGPTWDLARTPQLVELPGVRGQYVHRSQLSQEELAATSKR